MAANPGPGWNAVGTGDFNGDGHSDILFQNTSGQVAIWEMDGTTDRSAAGPVASNPGPSWKAVGTGDFNGDGNSDILWQNAASCASPRASSRAADARAADFRRFRRPQAARRPTRPADRNQVLARGDAELAMRMVRSTQSGLFARRIGCHAHSALRASRTISRGSANRARSAISSIIS